MTYTKGLIIQSEEAQKETMVSCENTIDSFHQFTVNNYLKKKICFSESDFDFHNYSVLFKSIISINNGHKYLNINDDNIIFEQIFFLLKTSSNKMPLFVKSKAGYGKTSFLSVLYKYLYAKFKTGDSDKLPIFISLHHYNKKIYDKNKNFFSQAKNQLVSDITPIFTYLENNKQQEVIIIIDGTDEFYNPKVDLDNTIFDLMNNISIKGKIIGLRSYLDKYKTKYRKEKECFSEEIPDVEIELCGVKVGTENYQKFVKSFSIIESKMLKKQNNDLINYIFKNVNKFNIKELDFFHLILLSRGFQSPLRYNTKKFSDFYNIYIEECGIDINEISELAFKIFNKPMAVLNEEKNNRIWWKIQKHDSIRDYFAAYNIVEKLIEYSDNNEEMFNFIYPYELNSFCKDIINENTENQREVFKSIVKLMPSVKLTAKTHFCYLLGRFDDEDTKNESIHFLKQLEFNVYNEIKKRIPASFSEKLSNENKKYLLYHRTICISLVCLGDKCISSDYIEKLVHNKYFDNLNRGFHLEYYEDIIFSPSSPDLLNNEDNLEGFPKTFNRLQNKLLKALKEKCYYPLFQIELHTICSLAQHRQAKGNLNEEKRIAISELIELTLNNNADICSDLRLYLSFIKTKLSCEGKFKVASFIKDMYSLKKIERKGWVDRNINNPETVASHIYGTLLLAYIHLPNSLEGEPNYNKDEIIRMLLVHDIGEAYIGDLTPKEKTTLMEEKEKEQLEYLNLIGMYDGLSSEMDLSNLFNKFTYNKGDINSIIAREMDKLDNLLQLYIYHNEFSIDDFSFFKSDLEKKIQSKIGIKIMNQIKELFE